MAKEVASRLQKLGYQLTLPVDTNMVFIDLDILGVSPKTFQAYCAREGLLVFDYNRIVVHHQTSVEAVDKLVNTLACLMDDVKNGSVQQV